MGDMNGGANEGGWSDGVIIRFKDGLPEKMGGWVSGLFPEATDPKHIRPAEPQR